MKSRNDKIAGAAHIKRHTEGTSNEISFSVLDAAKNTVEGGSRRASSRPRFPVLGSIALFTLGRGKKPISTPQKERGITLSTGEFVSSETAARESSTPQIVSGIDVDAQTEAVEVDVPPSDARKTERRSELSSNAISSWKNPEEEVARRKAARKHHKRLAVAACIAVIGAGVALGLTTLHAGYVDQQNKRQQLAEAIKAIEAADAQILPFDELVQESSSATLEQISASDFEDEFERRIGQLEDAEEALEQVKRDIEAMQAGISDVRDIEALNHAIETINARVNMIHSGQDALEEVDHALAAYDQALSGWGELLAADSTARAAADLVTETTPDNVRASIEMTNEAQSGFSQARQSIAKVPTLYEGVDVQVFLDYIDLRLEAQEWALASDQAVLYRDKETAASANNAYNEVDAQAAELIKQQDAEPAELVEHLYEEKSAPLFSSYEAERARAADADAFLRDYLGTFSK